LRLADELALKEFLDRPSGQLSAGQKTRVSLAKALMHLEKWHEAIDELGEAVRLNPTHPEPHLLLSRIYFRMGDEQKAAGEKEISLRLRRENPAVLEAVQSRAFPSTPGK